MTREDEAGDGYDARALGRARVLFGLIFVARTTPIFYALRAPFSAETFPLLGWPTGEWTIATGIALPSALVGVLCVVRTIAIVLFTCGVHARAAGLIAAGSGYLVLAQDRFAFINSLHVLFMGTFVLAFTTSPRPLVLRSDGDRRTSRASSVRLVACFLASIYFWSGAAKLQSDWLSGHALQAYARAGAFAGPLGAWVSAWSATAWSRSVAAWSVPALELSIAVLLVANRRRTAVLLALAFHVCVELIVNPDLLGWQMAALLVAIYPRREGS